MKEKVYLNRINVDYQSLYNRAKDYFHRNGVEIDFTFEQSDIKNLTYRIANFPQGQRVILQPTMSNVVPIDPTYDITSFVFNGREFPPPNIPTGFCYTSAFHPFIDINLDDRTPEANYLGVIHENMHTLVKLANQKGFITQDVMDTYYLNDQPENPLSNFGQQWVLLKPFIDHFRDTPNMVLTRTSATDIQTLGKLVYGTFSCFTLERPYKGNQPNISAIPEGLYGVRWTFSFRLLRYTYELQNVPNRSGIRIHSANYFSQLLGCIALGDSFVDINHDGNPDILNSKITVAKFEALMNKQPFKLLIQ